MDSLTEAKFIVERCFPYNPIVAITSQTLSNYNVKNAKSEGVLAILLPSERELYLNDIAPKQLLTDFSIRIVELREFIEALFDGDPYMWESLYSNCITGDSGDIRDFWFWLREQAEDIITADPVKAMNSWLEEMISCLNVYEENNPNVDVQTHFNRAETIGQLMYYFADNLSFVDALYETRERTKGESKPATKLKDEINDIHERFLEKYGNLDTTKTLKKIRENIEAEVIDILKGAY